MNQIWKLDIYLTIKGPILSTIRIQFYWNYYEFALRLYSICISLYESILVCLWWSVPITSPVQDCITWWIYYTRHFCGLCIWQLHFPALQPPRFYNSRLIVKKGASLSLWDFSLNGQQTLVSLVAYNEIYIVTA